MSKEVKLFIGPNHPGMHGNSSVHLYVEGDTVVKARLVPGFLHRGFEKLMERRLWFQNLALIPRICVPEPDINEMVYAMVVESLTGIELPERAQWIRMIILELARISSHLMSLGGVGGSTGLYTMNYWTMSDRDRILDIFEKITGARVYHMYIIPGGVRKSLPERIENDILDVLDYIESRMPEYENLLLKNKVIRTRTKGIAKLTEKEALEMGVTGVGLRATGLPYDIRKIDPYARYDKVEFTVPTATEGDAYARFTLKYLELQQSIKIIRQCIELMPKEGPVNVRFSDGSALRFKVPAGSMYCHVESSRGEYGYYVVSDGSEKPYRIHVRGASYPQGLYGVEKKLPGTRLEDVALWLNSMDFCPPEIDR
jgi:NADH-quinone oxidoreductase subunit D